MSRSVNMVLAGFGGQGVLFAGKLIAYAGLLEDREVSWLPSYGPETRFCEEETLWKAIEKCVPAKKAAMLDMNKRALQLGIDA